MSKGHKNNIVQTWIWFAGPAETDPSSGASFIHSICNFGQTNSAQVALSGFPGITRTQRDQASKTAGKTARAESPCSADLDRCEGNRTSLVLQSAILLNLVWLPVLFSQMYAKVRLQQQEPEEEEEEQPPQEQEDQAPKQPVPAT